MEDIDLSILKAIPTEYQGILFRSRFEADVAYFINRVGYDYGYERRSFLLDNGIHYLPDFYIPDLNLWIEPRGYKSRKGKLQIDGFKEFLMNQFIDDNIHEDFIVLGKNSLFFELFMNSDNFLPPMWIQGEIILAKCPKCEKNFFCCSDGSYHCRSCGHYDGDTSLHESFLIKSIKGKIQIIDDRYYPSIIFSSTNFKGGTS